MNCQEVRELSSDYLDHRLMPSEASLLEGHLKLCSGCREEIEALRRTISAIGSLDEIATSPDFLSEVHRKIEGGGRIKRLWAWFFEPTIIKVPLKVTALLLVSITAFYLYYRLPELSRESDVTISPDSFKVAQDKRRDKALEKKALGKRERQQSNRMAEPEAPAKLEAQLYQSRPSEAAKETFADRVASAPQSGFQEILADDVALYERRVKVLLGEMGGRLLVQEGFADSVLLTVELPQSRRAQFLATLKEEVGSGSEAGQLALGGAGEYREKKKAQAKDALSTAGRRLEPARKSSLGTDEPMVTLRLRIQPKK